MTKGWEKFTKEEIKEIHKKISISHKNRYKSGIVKHSFLGRKHTDETKRKMSESKQNSLVSNKGNSCKYYKLFCPLENEEIIVQGKWELYVALKLNENNILWTKNYKEHSFNYIRPNETNIRKYYPDFYLPEFDLYLEVKGGFNNWSDISPIEKMNNIRECNPGIKFLMIMEDDINEIGFKQNKNYDDYLNNPLDKKPEKPNKSIIRNSEIKKFQKERIDKVLSKLYDANPNIFLKFGWLAVVGRELNLTHAQTKRIMKTYAPEFLDKCFQRKSPTIKK